MPPSGLPSTWRKVQRAHASVQVVGGESVDVLCESSMDALLEQLHTLRPKAAIVDSVQTMSLVAVAGAPGSVAQARGHGQL